jgi:hypothetical protein
MAPGWVVVLVNVEPSLSVSTMMTGMNPVKPPFVGVGLAVEIDVRVEIDPVTVVVLPIVTRYI